MLVPGATCILCLTDSFKSQKYSCHPKEPVLGVDCPELPVAVRPQPGNVVADHGDLVPGQLRAHHGKVGLAARGRESGGDVLLDAVWPGDAGDEHVLGKPALLASHRRPETEREAFLAEQRVAAVAGTKAEDLKLVGAVGHQHLLKSSDDPGVVQD